MTISQMDDRVLVGTDVTLRCEASGNPTPVMSWEKDGEEIIPTENLIEISTNGSLLTIRNVTTDNAGWYTCTASNKVGRVLSGARLVIIGMCTMIANIY